MQEISSLHVYFSLRMNKGGGMIPLTKIEYFPIDGYFLIYDYTMGIKNITIFQVVDGYVKALSEFNRCDEFEYVNRNPLSYSHPYLRSSYIDVFWAYKHSKHFILTDDEVLQHIVAEGV